MKLFTRSLSLLFALIMSVSITACDNKHGMTESHPTDTTTASVQTETAEKKELKRVTVEEFANGLFIEGKHIPFPCTFGELCDSYDFASIEQGSWCYVNDKGFYSEENTGLCNISNTLFLHSSESGYDEGFLGCQVITEKREDYSGDTVIWLNYYPEKEHFDICGFNEKSSFDDMVSVLGSEYSKENYRKYKYISENFCIEISFETIENNSISNIIISLVDRTGTDYVATDDITIDGVEGKFPFHQSDLAKEFTIKRIATEGYDLHYGNNIWYGSFCRKDSPDDTVYYMDIYPTSKGINIFGYKIDDNSRLNELEKIYGNHKIVAGKPEFGGDIAIIETYHGNIECTIFFNDQNKVDFISIYNLDTEE